MWCNVLVSTAKKGRMGSTSARMREYDQVHNSKPSKLSTILFYGVPIALLISDPSKRWTEWKLDFPWEPEALRVSALSQSPSRDEATNFQLRHIVFSGNGAILALLISLL